MPAVSKKQQRFFGYLLSNPDERKKRGISKKAAKDFAQDVQEAKECPVGEYYCFDRGKCMPIPKGKKVRDDGELVSEVAPPGWGHTKAEKEKTKPWKPKSKIGGTAAAFKRALDDGRFKGLPGSKTKKEKTADMFKLMWSMKKKGDNPHYKPGTDKKYKKYQEEQKIIQPSMKDNNFFGNAYDGSYETLKKNIGSKKKPTKPAVEESVGEGEIERRAARSQRFHDFYKKARDSRAKQQSDSVRSDSKKHGIKFTDAKGSGRIRGGKKYYD